ncbi:Der GTPase-activating protein YihI [Vibrio quintilis]|uniref:Der GTPase-activating protein YihI n=1 Tax=Vibrio quintilis TaxID=1117707 RepID=A0A1M7YSD2_9VIBR|nr:Der GTPase-activating protein YihI [Vibrio quintilis]SHO55520.1 Der GTPase-activating protein YihI [Vibrio quintilis]
MTRRKVTTTGVNGDLVFARKSNRKSADVEGRLRKKEKKKKGLKTGSRHSQGQENELSRAKQQRDPRLGSKKKVPLIVEAPKKQTKQERRLSAEQELIQLENDAQLQVLLGRLENGEKLGAGLQKYVDEKLDRIEKLMKQSGLLEETDDVDTNDNQPEMTDIPEFSGEDELLQQWTETDSDKL